jgi:RNA polymerase sigma-70 factor (ECF subfamily)
MWAGWIIHQRTMPRAYGSPWPMWRRSSTRGMRALAPWLAALEMDHNQGAASAARSAKQARTTGEQVEFERLFTLYAAALLDYLYGLTRNRETATDLMQETFLRAYASSTPLLDIQRPKAWLYRIATNLALNHSRRQRQFVWLPLQTVEPLSAAGSSDRWRIPPLASQMRTGDDLAASVVERNAIWETLAALTPRQQAALLLQTSGGFEPREIAILLALSEANVRKILFRAKERFRALYQAMDSDDTAK